MQAIFSPDFLRRARLKIAAALPVFFILMGLGIWQLERLAWKEDLIKKISSRKNAPIATLAPSADWPSLNSADYEYRHVVVEGHYLAGLEALVFRSKVSAKEGDHAPGFLLVSPLQCEDGAVVMINRGFVPDFARDKSAHQPPPSGLVRVRGLMRAPETRNWFTPADPTTPNANAIWFTRDPVSLAEGLGLLPGFITNQTPLALFMIDADVGGEELLENNSRNQATLPSPLPAPLGGQSEMTIPNNHLSYALTWFGLAASLIAVFIAMLVQDWRYAKQRSQ